MFRLIISLVVLLTMITATGCSWIGHTAGKTQAKIERKIDAVEDGYNAGYEKEKNKTAK